MAPKKSESGNSEISVEQPDNLLVFVISSLRIFSVVFAITAVIIVIIRVLVIVVIPVISAPIIRIFFWAVLVVIFLFSKLPTLSILLVIVTYNESYCLVQLTSIHT